MRAALVALALFLLAGCVSQEPLGEQRFSVAISARGTTKRFVLLEVSFERRGERVPTTVELTDVTTIDDDVNAQHRIRIEPGVALGEPRPGEGHIEFGSVAVRPIDLVILYRGHEDLYHLTFPHEGGVLVEPHAGEFTTLLVKATR
jgi:hypothetical protein